LDDERWLRILQRMPEVEEAGGPPLAVAFIGADDYAAKRGHGLALVAGQSQRARPGRSAFDGRYPEDWGLLLVMNDTPSRKSALTARRAWPILRACSTSSPSSCGNATNWMSRACWNSLKPWNWQRPSIDDNST
jgi:hypothetical protein